MDSAHTMWVFRVGRPWNISVYPTFSFLANTVFIENIRHLCIMLSVSKTQPHATSCTVWIHKSLKCSSGKTSVLCHRSWPSDNSAPDGLAPGLLRLLSWVRQSGSRKWLTVTDMKDWPALPVLGLLQWPVSAVYSHWAGRNFASSTQQTDSSPCTVLDPLLLLGSCPQESLSS